MFAFYLKKLLRCPAAYAGALLFVASIVFSNTDDPLLNNPTYLYESSLYMGVTGYFIPVVTVLPVCFVRKELSRGSVWQLPLLRSSPRRFTAGGLGAACVSGAFVTVLGFALFFLGIVLSAGEGLDLRITFASPECSDVPANNPLYQGFYYRQPYWVVTLIEVSALAIRSMIYPAVAYLVSCRSDNQYLSAAAPFIFYILLLFSAQRLGYYVHRFFYYFDPNMLEPGVSDIADSYYYPLYLLGYVLTVVLCCGLLSARLLKRRLTDG